jgi:NAD(P)-dependent dehydrogenase (short-subunit alcohol dehydrogenase family)
MPDPARSAPVAVVTGATSGLGRECARALLARPEGWHVVLAVRDAERGATVVAELDATRRCTVVALDLAALASVRAFGEAYREQVGAPVSALVLNAGVQVPGAPRRTADGVELTFGVNHLGHAALVTGLRDQLAPTARVVIVASDTHDPRRRTGMPSPRYVSAEQLAHPQDGDGKDGRRRYTTSKLCNVLYAYELDRRLGDGIAAGAPRVTVTVMNPGLMPGSGLARDYGALQRFAWRWVMPALRVLPQVSSTTASGERLAALAADPRFAGVTGEYFDGLKPVRSSEQSYDRVLAEDLWEATERLVGGWARPSTGAGGV